MTDASTPRRPRPDEQTSGPQHALAGTQAPMTPLPATGMAGYRPAGKLAGKAAIVTDGDSGIGQAVAHAFALEGADVAILHLADEAEDAARTRAYVEGAGRRFLGLPADVRDARACREAVERVVAEFGRLDVLVNNAGWSGPPAERFEDLPEEQFRRAFETDVYGCFHTARAALPHLREGASIINTGSTTGILGHGALVDYAASKGAVHLFTKSLALSLAPRGIRVNAVAPGPVWTPIVTTLEPAESLRRFGAGSALGRAAQPEELAPIYVHLASADSSFTTGAVFEVSGGLPGSV